MSTTHLTTGDELWALPRDGTRRELVKGELKTMSPAGQEDGLVVMNLGAPLHQFVKAHRLGTVFGAETGFKIASNPDTVRAPDVAFVRRGRIPPGGVSKSFGPIVPDLVVEIVSPGDTVEEVDEKVADWLQAGAEAVWVVKPKSRTVAIYRAANAVQILAEGEEIDGGAMLPGFRLAVAELFSD